MRLDKQNELAAKWRSSGSLQARRSWPDAVSFREAIQHPESVLSDPLLKSLRVSVDRMGMPLSYSGRFAVVFRLTTPENERWALRCFTSPGDDGPGMTRAQRYMTLSEYTTRLPNTFVPFRYIDEGILSGANWYPALSMRWAPGEPLGRWIEGHLNDPDALRTLCGTLSGVLERLEKEGIAHGDWQHDNLIVSEDGRLVTLVDYDGMYVPEFAGTLCPEMGHPNYQHPARTDAHFGPGLDRFACLVIETALLALSRQPSLWAQFADGESVLFKQSDLQNPDRSPVFAAIRAVAELNDDELLAESMVRLVDACRAGADSTLLPAIEASAAPPPIFAASADHFLPTSVKAPVTGSKWWQIPEATPVVAAPTPTWYAAATGQAGPVAQRMRIAAGQATASTVSYEYLTRLGRSDTIIKEQSHLWKWRGGSLAFSAFVTYLIYEAIVQQSPQLILYFLWVLNFATLGYGRWPQKRIYDELVSEIGKMETQIDGRTKRMNEKTNGFSSTAHSQTSSAYIEQYLKKTPISQVVVDETRGIKPSTLGHLRRMNVDDGLTLRVNLLSATLGQLPYEQLVALERWKNDVEMQAADEYRKITAKRPQPVEVDRLRHEIAEFQRHVALLKQERDLFPDVSFGAYLKKLGGNRTAAAGKATTP